MIKADLIIFSEQSRIFKLYSLVFRNYFNSIETFLINDHHFYENVDFQKFNFILIDLESKKYIPALNSILEKNIKNCVFILITPYELTSFSHLLKDAQFFNLILTKPFEINKLEQFIKIETNKIEIRNILEKKNNVLAKVVDLNPSKIAIYTYEDGILFYANNNYLKFTNLTLNHIDYLKFNEISTYDVRFEEIKSKLKFVTTFTYQKQDGTRWLESTFYVVPNEFIIHVCNDITEQKEKELQLEQYAIFFENSNEGIIITDFKTKILSVNKSFSKITGYRKDEVIGKKPSILKSGIQDKNFYIDMWESLKNNSSWQGEIWNKRKNGEVYPEWLSIAKVFNPKYNEEFYIAIFTDVTSLKEADKKLYFYANHDVLTKLANRVQFESYLKSNIESCKRRNEKLALFFIDLDKFKEINDTYGHTVGDEMLITVSKRLTQSIRKEDFIARLGGDEFVLIIKDVKNETDMLHLAKKINDNVKEPIQIADKVFFMTLSIGIAIFPEHGSNSEDLIKFADAAMYETKETGRNGFTLYNQTMTEKVSQKLTMQNELKVAFKKDEFLMYYQPIVNTNNKKILGAEALVRWNHKERGILTPINFISFIDEGGMGIEFGQLIIKKVLADIQVINSKLVNRDFKISINISAEYFFRETFINELIEYCKDFQIEPKQIELEFLETHIMKNSNISIKKIEELNKHGFTMAIDDFGTGYSSLSYLKNFKVDKLKIDQSFIKDFLEDNNDKAIVEAIINLGNTFNLKVQAEGVETQEHQELLLKLNCTLAQGYYYNKPLPLSKLLDELEKDAN